MKKILIFALFAFFPVYAALAAVPTSAGLVAALKSYTTPPPPKIIKAADLISLYKIYATVKPEAPAAAVPDATPPPAPAPVQ